MDPFKPFIDAFLRVDDYQATWIFGRIKHMVYTGCYEMVKLYDRGIKEPLKRIAYVHFETEPGYQAQMNWAEFQISDAAGRDQTVYIFSPLWASAAIYARFVNQCTSARSKASWTVISGHFATFEDGYYQKLRAE